MAEREQSRPVGDCGQEFTFKHVQLLKNETLGTGSYGAVCKAKCDQLICAVKLLYPVLFRIQAPDPGKDCRHPFCRFEQECRFLSHINHPNIVQYLGTYHDPDTKSLVLLMELMDESLTHFLESSHGDIPYHIQVNLSQDIAQALAFLHTNGIIHRDLSSNNVLLIAGTRAKVSDFGMSKFADINTTRPATLTQCPGTPAYMSPEALDEPPVYTEKLDNFSFGVILIQLVTKQFPAPSDRFAIEQFSDHRNPSNTIRARVLIPEVERRQAHISLIEPTHPLLPIALECLKDETDERPSSQQLCQSLDGLRRAVPFEESQNQDMVQGQVNGKEQIQTTDDEICVKCEHKGKQLKVKDEMIQIFDKQMCAKDQDLKSLQHEVKALEHQLRELNQQLESNEETVATLQHTVAQRDREIAELRGLLASTNCDETSQLQYNIMRGHTAQATVNSQINISWETLYTGSPGNIRTTSAVVGDKVYFCSEHAWEFTLTDSQWKKLYKHPLGMFSLVNIENELTTVGGCSWLILDSNKLYSYIEGQWVEKYPPMPNRRRLCASVYTNKTLIVVGGVTVPSMTTLSTVETLNIISKQWSQVCSLPFQTFCQSVSLCGDFVYVSSGLKEDKQVVRCSLPSLTSDVIQWENTAVVEWKQIASLPVERCTLVTIKGHLLTVGGMSAKGKRIRSIYQYNPVADSWQVISRMNVARSECAAALLPDNKLIVAGGTPDNQIEVATISDCNDDSSSSPTELP